MDVDAATTVSEVLCALHEHPLVDVEEPGLQLVIAAKMASTLSGMYVDDNLMDHISKYESVQTSRNHKEWTELYSASSRPWTIALQKRMFLPWPDLDGTEITNLDLIWLQIWNGMKCGIYHSDNADDLAANFAIRYFIAHGGTLDKTRLQSQIKSNPVSGTKMHSLGVWVEKVASAFMERGFRRNQVSATDLKREFVEHARTTWTREFSLKFLNCSIQTYATGTEDTYALNLWEAKARGMSEAMFNEIDADSNGKLTVEEFNAWRLAQNQDDGVVNNKRAESSFDESWAAEVIEVDVAVLVNAKGLIITKQTKKGGASDVCTVQYDRIRQISRCGPSKVHAMKGVDSFTITLIKNNGTLQLMEIVSEQAGLILQTVNRSYRGIQHRSRHCVAKEPYVKSGQKYGGDYLEFNVGDVIVLDESDAEAGNYNTDFHRASCHGVCSRTALGGEVPMSKVILIPSLTLPTPSVIHAYVSASDRRGSTKHQIANMMQSKDDAAADGVGGFGAFGKLAKRINDRAVTASSQPPKPSLKGAAFGVIASARFESKRTRAVSPQPTKPSFVLTKSAAGRAASSPKPTFKGAAFGVIASSRFASRAAPPQPTEPSFVLTNASAGRAASPANNLPASPIDPAAAAPNTADMPCTYLSNCPCKDCA